MRVNRVWKIFRLEQMSDDFHRLKIVRAAVCIAFITGILSSLELWFPWTREFPRAPFFIALPETIVAPVERLLCFALLAALIALAIGLRPKISSVFAVALLVIFVFFDQMRLQPWVYQYLLSLILLLLHDWQEKDESRTSITLSLLQLVFAALYIWSGIQKLNHSFVHETLPDLLAPLPDFISLYELSRATFGVGAAIAEIAVGGGLLFVRTRNFSVALAIVFHLFVLGLLVAKDYNSIVWVWNAALIPIIIILFCRSRASFWKEIIVFREKGRIAAAKTVVLATILLPILSFWGWWDLYLSGAFYSGNTPVAVVKINEETGQRLSPKAQQQLFRVESSGEQILPLLEWSLSELNVPIYPEQRVFNQVARRICQLTSDKEGIELIVKERPATINGNYQVKRTDCEELIGVQGDFSQTKN